MSDPNVVDTPDVVTDTPAVVEWSVTIEDTKAELAEMYLNFLDSKKEGIVGTTASLGVNLNPLKKDAINYLTSDTSVVEKSDIFSNLRKNLKKALLGKITWWTSLEYNQQALDKMKALILASKDNQAKLQELMSQIQSGVDPTLGVAVASTAVTAASWEEVQANSFVEYIDKTNREKVITAMDMLLEKDKAGAIPYVRWGEDLEKEWGLDCSGMVDYILNQAWLDWATSKELKSRNTTREYFKETNAHLVLGKDEATTKEEWLALIKKENRLSWLKKWDVIIWNSVAEAYKPNWALMKNDDKEYYLHHMGMIEKVDIDAWTIDIVESNGKEGVTKSTIDIWDRLHGENHKAKQSEFYVGAMNYNNYPAKQENLVA